MITLLIVIIVWFGWYVVITAVTSCCVNEGCLFDISRRRQRWCPWYSISVRSGWCAVETWRLSVMFIVGRLWWWHLLRRCRFWDVLGFLVVTTWCSDSEILRCSGVSCRNYLMLWWLSAFSPVKKGGSIRRFFNNLFFNSIVDSRCHQMICYQLVNITGRKELGRCEELDKNSN